jgi:hypothetical protein
MLARKKTGNSRSDFLAARRNAPLIISETTTPLRGGVPNPSKSKTTNQRSSVSRKNQEDHDATFEHFGGTRWG